MGWWWLAASSVCVLVIAALPDLKVLGGLEPLIKLLEADQQPSLQAGAAYVLGTAASNNAKLAGEVLQEHPKLLQQLLKVSLGSDWNNMYGVCVE